MVSEPLHRSVMPTEAMTYLAVREGQVVVDATAGGGGHTALLAAAVGKSGMVIATDRDPRAFADDMAGGVAKRFKDTVRLRHRAFSEIEAAVAAEGVTQVDAVLADLGVSSVQLDDGARGFSFQQDAPLDMRMDTSTGETAQELIARLDEEELANVIYEYGDERMSRRIARAIKRSQPLPATTGALADTVARAMGGKRERIHPATRTFQALRIAVNQELSELDALLAALPNVVKPGGRAVLISFHSLEDGRVKRCFVGTDRGAGGSDEGFGALPGAVRKANPWRVLTKRPVEASEEERKTNPRARSAKLRAAERIRIQESA